MNKPLRLHLLITLLKELLLLHHFIPRSFDLL
jgi:hypothetical protein